MAGNISDFAENKLLEHCTGRTVWTPPATTYLALYTTAPSDAGGGTEVSGSGYARQSIAWAAASAGVIPNSSTITFTATGSWGTVTHVGIFDASSAGNLLWWGPLAASRTINTSGDSLQFAVGQLSLTLD